MPLEPQICALIETVGAAPSVLARAGGFFGLWLMISSGSPSDLPIGLAVAAAATWASVRLLPSGASRPNPVALATIALRFPGQAVIAGADVARRALDPRLPLSPGFLAYPARLPSGPARNAFAVLIGLLPGTVPIVSEKNNTFAIHCLDINQPVEAQLRAEEDLLRKALGVEYRDG
jgi:multicomponent Na+:H+ antiporter subunit E